MRLEQGKLCLCIRKAEQSFKQLFSQKRAFSDPGKSSWPVRRSRNSGLKSKALEYLASQGHTDPSKLPKSALKQLETAFDDSNQAGRQGWQCRHPQCHARHHGQGPSLGQGSKRTKSRASARSTVGSLPSTRPSPLSKRSNGFTPSITRANARLRK